MPDIFLYQGEAAPRDVKLRDPTISGAVAQTLFPSLFTNAQTFGHPVVTATYTLLPTKYTNSQTFGIPVVTTLTTLLPTKLPSSLTFGTPVVTTSYTILPAKFSNVTSFGTPAVTSVVVLSPTKFSNINTFGIPVASPGPVTLHAIRLTNDTVFFVEQIIGGELSSFFNPRRHRRLPYRHR